MNVRPRIRRSVEAIVRRRRVWCFLAHRYYRRRVPPTQWAHLEEDMYICRRCGELWNRSHPPAQPGRPCRSQSCCDRWISTIAGSCPCPRHAQSGLHPFGTPRAETQPTTGE